MSNKLLVTKHNQLKKEYSKKSKLLNQTERDLVVANYLLNEINEEINGLLDKPENEHYHIYKIITILERWNPGDEKV